MSKFLLKFIWLERLIAVSLDQKVGAKTIPITSYFFWPRSDAWEDMRVCLENMPWISETEVILILNQITEVINFWQDKKETSKKKDLATLLEKFPLCKFIVQS